MIFLQNEDLTKLCLIVDRRETSVSVTVTFIHQLLWSQEHLKHACLQQHVVPLQCYSRCYDNLFCKHLSYPIKCLSVTARKGFPKKKKTSLLSVLLLSDASKTSQFSMCLPARLAVAGFMLHVYVISGCFLDSPGPCLNFFYPFVSSTYTGAIFTTMAVVCCTVDSCLLSLLCLLHLNMLRLPINYFFSGTITTC